MTTKPNRATTRKSLEQSVEFEPALTEAQVRKMEIDYNKTWGVKRRVMNSFLSNSSASLLSRIKCAKDAEVLLMMAEHILDFKKHLLVGAKLADLALDRLQALADHLDKVFAKKGGRSHE